MLYDAFLFYNEMRLLEIRLNELKNVVDRFVIVESNITFQGKPKPLYFWDNRDRFSAFQDRIIHVPVVDMPATDDPWQREYYQRNCIARGLTDCSSDDVIMISDADEIPKADVVAQISDKKYPGIQAIRVCRDGLNTGCGLALQLHGRPEKDSRVAIVNENSAF